MLRNDEFEFVTENVLNKVMVITRDIKAGENIDFSSYPYDIRLKGNIQDGVIVEVPYNLMIEGNIGKNCKVTAKKGLISVRVIGDDAQLDANSRIEAECAGNRVSLKARDNIKIGNVGTHCKLAADNVICHDVGESSVITASWQVRCHDAGKSVTITSEKSEIRLNNIGADAIISAFSNIFFNSIDPTAKVESSKGELMIAHRSNYRVYQLTPKPTRYEVVADETKSTNVTVVVSGNVKMISTEMGNFSFAKDKQAVTTLFAEAREAGKKIALAKKEEGEKVTYVISNTESPIVNQTELHVVSEEDVLVQDVVVSQGGIYARGRGNATVQNSTAKGDITTVAGVGTEEEMDAMNAFLSKLK